MTTWKCSYPITVRGVTEPCGETVWRPPLDEPKASCSRLHPPLYWTPSEGECDARTGTTRHTVAPSDVPEATAAASQLADPTPLSAPSAPPTTRQRLPPERRSVTKKFKLAYTHKDGTPDFMRMYVTAGLYDDGRLGEIFIRIDRMGTLAHGALDATATMVSLLLQYGVPLSVVTEKLLRTRYEPSGFTGDKDFPSCTSALDLVAQWLHKKFGETQ